MRRLALVITALTLLGAACSGTPDADRLIGIRASSDLAVGDSRLLFGVHEIGGTRRGGPDELVTVVASPLDAPDDVIGGDATYTWIVPEAVGMYLVNIPFDRPGTWQIKFTISTGEPTAPFLVDIQAQPRTTAIGEAAPLTVTRTLADTAITDLTTDHDPLDSLYELSLNAALSNDRKTVVVFATPAFCTTAACGPMLDQVKVMSGDYPAVDFLHIEIYEGFGEPGFTPDADHLAPAVVAFGLPTEPWVFVVDEHGVVIGRFDAVLGEGEVQALLDE